MSGDCSDLARISHVISSTDSEQRRASFFLPLVLTNLGARRHVSSQQKNSAYPAGAVHHPPGGLPLRPMLTSLAMTRFSDTPDSK